VLNSSILYQNHVSEKIGLFCCINPVQIQGMICGYARVSTDGQSVDAQVKALANGTASQSELGRQWNVSQSTISRRKT